MKTAQDPPSQDPLAELWRSWSALAAAAVPSAEALSGLPQASAGATAPIQAVLAQAQVAGAASLLKVWSRSAQSLLEYQREWQRGAEADAPPAATALAAQVDHARAHLRRLSEIALEEGEALDSQMQALDQNLRALLEEPAAAPSAPRRYARAKP